MIVKKTLKFTVLTYIHIGSGKKILPLEYVKLGNYIFYIDETKLLNELKASNLLEDYVKQLTQNLHNENSRKFSLTDYLQSVHLLNENFLHKIAKFKLPHDMPRNLEIQEFIKNYEGFPYIPGSSIKGAIRIAILYSIIKQLPENLRNKYFTSQVYNVIQDIRTRKLRPGKAKKAFGRKIDRILQKFHINNKIDSPNTDILKTLIIRDSNPLNPQDSMKITTANIIDSRTGKLQAPIGLEVIKPNTTFEIEIAIDVDLLSYYRKSLSLHGISFDTYEALIMEPLRATSAFTEEILKHEEKSKLHPEFKGFLKTSNTPNFRLGWGQGLLSTSLYLLLPNDLKAQVRKFFFKNMTSNYPNTRKISEHNLLGFCHVE